MLFRNSASKKRHHHPDRVPQPHGNILMLSYLCQYNALYMYLNQSAVCLPVKDMVGKHDVHDGTDPHHRILPDKLDMVARINGSHYSLTAAVSFLSKVVSLLGA